MDMCQNLLQDSCVYIEAELEIVTVKYKGELILVQAFLLSYRLREA